MHLVMFDIDGTLTNTTRIDSESYVRAVREVLSLESIDTHWDDYRHVTDSGIVAELLERAHMPLALALRVRKRLVEMLQEAVLHGARIAPVAGADDLLRLLAGAEDVQTAIATGCWRDSATFKLAVAGLNVKRVPIATADDSYCRTTIMRTACKRAMHAANIEAFETVTYVGDASWDIRAARELGWAFIGRATGRREQRLRELGAGHVLADFTDTDAFLTAWHECRAGAFAS